MVRSADTNGEGALVYRAPMRSRDDSVPGGAAVERALELGMCGVGGRVSGAPSSVAEAARAVADTVGERTAARLERFAAAPSGSLVWTRDADGLLWLGRLAGPWRYDPSREAAEVDLVHVRPCDWLDRPVDAEHVPPAVRASFDRGGRNWQRIRAPGGAAATSRVWSGYRNT